ncbi:MAG: putative structural protein [Prokaryotic dsDNA virus sp.]|jgi:hypothetical protein|nr:MAG: putative structural protein [Prokaryotic dsDNA virus sp.]|tara:strand:+ start:2481 stop:3383 length:903 start_codon:yes stop_codon:yes gene_type:complete
MGAGFKVWSTGDLVNASDFNNYIQEQVVMVFDDSTARDSAVSSPEEGMFCYLKDSNTLQFYNGSAWANFIGEGDITGVTAGSGLSGGGTSGAVTLDLDINELSSVTPATGDEISIADVSASNAVKKTTLNDLPISSATQTALDNITAGTSTLTVPITVKVADDGSGSQNVFYFLNGTDTGAGTRSVSMDLTTGFKYKFDISDSSNSGHPLKFSTTKDGTHASGSAFTTNVTESGTAGTADAYVEIEITPETLGIAGATPTLYYYCPNHSGMGGEGMLSLLPSASAGFSFNTANGFFALNG